MADRDARPSTDRENAPLLRDIEQEQHDRLHESRPSFAHRLASALQEPLTPLTKVLLIAALIFLLLSSIFIGLFAGARHNLNVERGRSRHGGDHSTVTETTTSISATTSTATSATTSVSTTVTTSISTTTQTSTVTIPGPGPTGSPEERTCLSSDCIVLSAAVLSSLDTTQDPCENFYEFSTGGWRKAHPIPPDKGALGNFELLSQENKRVIQQMLEDDSHLSASSSYDDQILKKLRDLYSSCMNENALDKRGIRPLVDVVQNVQRLYKGDKTTFPHSNDPDYVTKDRQGLTAALAYLHSRSIGALFSFYIDGDIGEDPNLMSLWFGQPQFGLPSKEYYEDESIRDFYTNILERVLNAIYEEENWDGEPDLHIRENHDRGIPLNIQDPQTDAWPPPWPWPPSDPDEDRPTPQEKARQHAKKVVEFERRLAQATLDLDILYGDPYATYNPVSVSKFTEVLPQFHFSTYLSTFAPRNFPKLIIVTDDAYAKFLSKILIETPADIVEAYLVSRTALSLSPYLGQSTEPWKAVRSLEEELHGMKKGAVGDRAEFCTSTVEMAMGFAAGRYFVNETFAGDSKEKGTKVITDIVKTFKHSLPDIEWMDEESASAAAQKADAIRVKVGYPISPNTKDAESIARYYSLVHIDENKFFENILSARTSDQVKMWAKLGKRRDLDNWEMYPSTVNAYFNPPANEIVFPAGILQPPFFQRQWPSYMNYGSFGMVASHELTHAFDSAGRLFNQEGKLEEWWTKATSDGFNARKKCISKQYSSYTIDDGKGGKLHVNGDLTSGENIGDSGLIQAYRAWKAQYDVDDNDFLLPGLNYTREQLFFISAGRTWAQNIKPASAIARLRSDAHSPNRWRVDGTVTNIPEFAEAFKCSDNAKLNPRMEDRCLLW